MPGNVSFARTNDYEAEFHAWSKRQGALLRRLATIIEHLIRLQASPAPEARAGRR